MQNCATEVNMSETRRPIHVVVAYDFTPSAELALARAIEVAARAPQHVLHIVAALAPRDRTGKLGMERVTYETAEHIQGAIKDQVAAAFQGRPTAAEIEFFVHARIGKPAEEILDLASEIGADLIFIGSHGKVGLERMLLGSVSEQVVREAQCPVMVCRNKTYADVDLLKVMPYEHTRAPHREPHRYTYVDHRVITRPRDWPLS
jgi:nucleotide-binding universal stress UspA family protein